MTKTWDDIMATPMKDIERMANALRDSFQSMGNAIGPTVQELGRIMDVMTTGPAKGGMIETVVGADDTHGLKQIAEYRDHGGMQVIEVTDMEDGKRGQRRFVMTTDTTAQGRTCIKCGRGGVIPMHHGGGVLHEDCSRCHAVYLTDYRYGPGKIMLVMKNAAGYSQTGAEAFRIDPRSVQHVWPGEGRYHVGDMLTPQDVDWLWRAFTLRNPIRTAIEHLGKRFIPVGKKGWKWINEDDGYPVDDEGDWLALAVAVHDRRSLYGCVRKWAATLTPQDLQDFKSQQIVAVAMNGFNDWEHGPQHSTLANELMSLASTQRGWSPRQAYEQKMSMGRDKRFVLPVEPQIVHPWQTRGWDEGRKDRHYKKVLKK